MSAAVSLRDIICETADILMIAIIPPHGSLDCDAVFLAVDANRRLQHTCFIGVQMADESFDTALIVKLCDDGLFRAFVRQNYHYARVQKGEFPQAAL